MRVIVIILIAATILLSGTTVLATEMYGEEGSAHALFQHKCNQCHSTNWATERRKTREEWAATVMRMKNVNGASMKEEEAGVIIDYLTENYGNQGMHHHGMHEMEHK